MNFVLIRQRSHMGTNGTWILQRAHGSWILPMDLGSCIGPMDLGSCIDPLGGIMSLCDGLGPEVSVAGALCFCYSRFGQAGPVKPGRTIWDPFATHWSLHGPQWAPWALLGQFIPNQAPLPSHPGAKCVAQGPSLRSPCETSHKFKRCQGMVKSA